MPVTRRFGCLLDEAMARFLGGLGRQSHGHTVWPVDHDLITVRFHVARLVIGFGVHPATTVQQAYRLRAG